MKKNKNHKQIPKLEEIIRCCNENTKIRLNWKNFFYLQKLAANSSPKIKRKARLYLGYYLCILKRKNIMESLPSESYIILDPRSERPSKKDIINPYYDGKRYGFYREEDAQEYSEIAFQKIARNIIIEKYHEVFPVEEEFL